MSTLQMVARLPPSNIPNKVDTIQVKSDARKKSFSTELIAAPSFVLIHLQCADSFWLYFMAINPRPHNDLVFRDVVGNERTSGP